jgi:hypothetical protein
MTSPSFHSSPSCRVLAFARTWSIDGLDPATMLAFRERIRDLGAELIVVTNTGAWAFNGSDDDGEYRDRIAGDLATAASMFAARAGGDAVFVVDGPRVVRVGHDATSIVEALDAAAELLVTRRIATTTARTPIASLHRWTVEHAS